MHDLVGKSVPTFPGHARHHKTSSLAGGKALFGLGNGLRLPNMQPLPLHAQAVEAFLRDGTVVEGIGRERSVRGTVNEFRLHDGDARVGERSAVIRSTAAKTTAFLHVKIAAAFESNA